MKNKSSGKQKNFNKSKRPELHKKSINNNIESFKIIDIIFEKYGLFILFSLIAIITFIVFKDFIFFKKVYLFKDIGSDSINYNYPQFVHIADYLRNEGMPKWSFNQGMGQNIFPLSFQDPFSSLLFIMGKDNIASGMAYIEIIKVFFAGFFFYLFLKKISIAEFPAVIGSILYSFSSFIILGGEWAIFSTEAVYAAFLLYAFEKLYQDNKWFLFPVAIFLITILQPFDLYAYGLFLFIYFLFRFFEDNKWEFNKFSVLLLKLVGLGLIGIAISSFFLINDIIQMLQSPRVGGEASYFSKLMSKPVFGFEGKVHNVTAIMRFFSSDMIGTGSNFRGWINYLEAPLFYCGLIALLLFPLVFLFLDKRKKILYFILLLIFIIPVIFPFFRYSFWLFTGDYYRAFSFLVALVILIFAIKAFDYIDKNSKINFLIIVAVLFFFLILLYYPYFPNDKVINENLRDKATVFLIIYSFLIYLFQFKNIKNIIKTIIVFAVLIELAYFSYITINDRPAITRFENKQKIGYNDYTNDAIAYLNSRDKSFFRVNKDFFSGLAIHESINDAKVQNYKGTPSYHSFNQINYIKFLQELDIVKGTQEFETRWSPGVSNVPLLHSFANIKYSLSKAAKPQLLNFNYDSVTTIGDVKILKNKSPLPLGFTFDKFINLKDFRKLSQQQKCIALYKAFVVDSANAEKTKYFLAFPFSDTLKNYTWEEFAKDIASLKKDTLVIKKYSQNNIKGEIKLDRKKMLFFSIPFDKGWSAKVDGKTETLLMIDIGFTGLLLDKGNHSIELSYLPPFYYAGAYISLISVFVFILILLIKKFL
ncbi:MAG: YfhO family protein [Bacteroidales bacterium]|nr:YfhO family protein [Bacteroidales bacterium]